MEDAQDTHADERADLVGVHPGLVAAGLLIGLWASLPPFVGPELVTTMRVEIVDHPVPALAVLAVTAWASWVRRTTEVRLFAGGLVIILAGLWMTVTHVPLVAQAIREQVTWAPTVSHSLPGVAVLILGGVWTARYR